MGRPTRDELEAENARLGERVRDLEGEVADRDSKMAEQDERLRKLEELIEQLRRRGKRQAAPFSKGDPVLSPRPFSPF